jgi:hypothetical protein
MNIGDRVIFNKSYVKQGKNITNQSGVIIENDDIKSDDNFYTIQYGIPNGYATCRVFYEKEGNRVILDTETLHCTTTSISIIVQRYKKPH